jgi:photosystem II stability/assembly factor-like uncharacterized protein
MNDRLSSGLRRTALAAFVLVAALFVSANALAAAPPAVCGCTAGGPYTAPATVGAQVTRPTVAKDGGSPNRQYFVVPGADGHSLSIDRGSQPMLTIGLDSLNAGWGFSPDSDRFAVIQDVAGVTNVSLYDLPTGKRVWSDNESVGSAGIGFSPDGSYFLWAYGGNQQSTVAVVDSAGRRVLSLQLHGSAGWGFSPDGGSFLVTTGQTDVNGNSSDSQSLYDLASGKRVWQDSANGTSKVYVSLSAAFSPHGKYVVAADTYTRSSGAETNVAVVSTAKGNRVFDTTLTARSAGWGFSSDPADRAFLVAVGDANVPATHLALVDDETGRTSNVAVPAGRAFWSFSPCGDVLGVGAASNYRGGELDLHDVDAALFSTLDGTRLGQQSFQSLWRFQFTREKAPNAISDLTDGARIVSSDDLSVEKFAPIAPTLAGQPCSKKDGGLGTLTGVSIGGETTAGGSAPGTIRTDGSFAMTVALSSSSPSVTVPPSILVPPGDGMVTFPITVAAGAADAAVTITATATGAATPGVRTTTLVVIGQCGVTTPVDATSGKLSLHLAEGGLDAKGALDATITAARPGDAITLTSNDAATLAVPASITAPGHSRQTTVTVHAGSPAADTAVTITAMEGKDVVSAAVVVKAIREPEQVYVLPTQLYSGDKATGTVLLRSPALPCGSPISLTSDSSALHLPASVTVPAGATRVDFPVTSDVVDQTGFVLVHATGGAETVTGSVNLLAHPKLQSLTLDSPVVGGHSAEGEIVLTSSAPPPGVEVSLTSDNPAVTVPQTWDMTQYQSKFPIDTTAVDADTTVRITASFEGKTVSATMLVEASAPVPTTGWLAATSAPTQRGALNAVAYVDDSHAIAVGDGGVVEETSDGGSTWTQIDSGTAADLYAVSFVDVRHGWIAGDGVVLATADGGATWTTQLANADDQLDAVAFVDAEHGFAAGSACGDSTPFCGGVVLETSDGGATWTTVNPCGSFSCSGIAAIDPISPTHVWLGGGNGSMLESVDGGVTWVERDPPLNPYGNIDSVSFSGSHGVIVGANGLIAVTDDGGATWDQIDVSTQRFWDTYSSAAAIDASNIVAVGARGGVIRSLDGGRTWSEDSHDPESGLNGVAVRGADHGIAVGQNGAILVYRGG